MRRRRLTLGMSAAIAAAATVALANPAAAVPSDKLQVLSGWTQTSAGSEAAFHTARAHQGDWAAYGFDWSTDKCSSSPDNPFGFPFENACIRHDFGYRNYKAAGRFDAHKSRLDNAFYSDMKRVCAGYSGGTATACNSTAWTYYQAVSIFGVSAADAPAKAAQLPEHAPQNG